MVTDPISDFLIRIKNAGYAGKETVLLPFSKMKLAIAETLAAKGYLGKVSIKGKTPASKYLSVGLVYENGGRPKVNNVKRISKPSRRTYEKAKKIKSYRMGYGLAILSTTQGIMADTDARKANVGGELLFTIW